MPRFAHTKYTPVQDSSPGLRSVDPQRLVLHRPWHGGDKQACPCGCGEAPTGATATFRMGHDAKLRGKLIRAHLMGVEVVYYRDLQASSPIGPYSAIEVAEQYGWRPALEAAALKREGKNRELLRSAIGSKRLVKVGRWEYTGQVAAVYQTADGQEYLIRYVTRMGESKEARVPADEAPLAMTESRGR